MESGRGTELPAGWDRGGDGLARLGAGDGRTVVVKRRRTVPGDFFAAEARGLAILAEAGALRTPTVLGVTRTAIALEDLGSGQPSARDWAQAGAALARQHAGRGPGFGFPAPGYIGDSAQDNAWEQDGHRFFAERRLLPQARRARDAGLLPPSAAMRIDRLASRLDRLLPESPPVLLHGDLWLGNLHPCANGELALIDAAAVHFGWAGADLAMLGLFGTPPPAFLEAYVGAGGRSDWKDHADLLNLYHLLNHLNLFGAGYRSAVLGVLDRHT
ncbi:fructosamine kinase family protein [Pseudomarimonas salicorniae]|uniref:Fructosamine kinase family protein n=1 Tax=Pseudomarimonas salicorniae TaxID=2933270 RepID=A0ABT0GIM1_9GAMM|nr:fructosamine kinase family protein [Lysobacter sp. CAU 1642]MCK7594397.1 fructosamine kinase family protein [Lysobacter sp. CAU 1642]